MLVGKTVFTLEVLSIGKPPGMEAIDIAASDIEEALAMVREHYNNPRVKLIMDKGQMVFTRMK
jgi:hypothetical protein